MRSTELREHSPRLNTVGARSASLIASVTASSPDYFSLSLSAADGPREFPPSLSPPLQLLNLVWEKCPVYEFVNVVRCFKCLGFNHFSEDVKKKFYAKYVLVIMTVENAT